VYILLESEVIKKIFECNREGLIVKFWILYREEFCDLYKSFNNTG